MRTPAVAVIQDGLVEVDGEVYVSLPQIIEKTQESYDLQTHLYHEAETHMPGSQLAFIAHGEARSLGRVLAWLRWLERQASS